MSPVASQLGLLWSVSRLLKPPAACDRAVPCSGLLGAVLPRPAALNAPGEACVSESGAADCTATAGGVQLNSLTVGSLHRQQQHVVHHTAEKLVGAHRACKMTWPDMRAAAAEGQSS